MKQRSHTSIDGFIPRRAGSQLGDLHERERETPIDRSLHTGDNTRGVALGLARKDKLIGRSDLDESLRGIDQPEEGSPRERRAQKRRDKKNKKDKKHKSKTRRIIKWVGIALLIALIIVGGYFAFKAINASDSLFKGNIFGLAKTDPLKQDANGRSNFLIVGTSEDDPGHQGANLTDSILVLSVNQTTKEAYTFSIPRDLNVRYGEACLSGYSGKINVYFSCSNEGENDAAEQDRLAKTQAFIGDIIGMDIQYGVHVNYTVMRDIVNAIGGTITVNIEGDDGTGQSSKLGIMDSNFDWKCGSNIAKRKVVCPPNGHFIEYKPGPQVLDAEHALYLAQARGDSVPTYGLAQSNFDRERNQQKIIIAIREKAMSAGTLSNPSKVINLIDALGNNLRTNVATNEIQTLIKLAQDIPSDKIKSIDLRKTGEAVFDASAQPVAGEFNYTALRAYLNKVITQEPFVVEEPHVIVLNGSEVGGMAQIEAEKLEGRGFVIDSISNAPEGSYGPYTIYDVTKNSPLTAAKLQQLYGGKILTTAPPVSVVGTTDFVIIIGPAS